MSWWFLSFSGEYGAVGGCYVEADDAQAAQRKATALCRSSEYDNVGIVGPIRQEDLNEHVPEDVRGIWLPKHHPHLTQEPVEAEVFEEAARRYGEEFHRHPPLD